VLQLNNLVQNGIVEAYPPLCDKRGSYTAQFEHVSFLKSHGRLLMRLTRFVDYPAATHRQGGYQSRRGLLDARKFGTARPKKKRLVDDGYQIIERSDDSVMIFHVTTQTNELKFDLLV
jgi:hypothetical protein